MLAAVAVSAADTTTAVVTAVTVAALFLGTLAGALGFLFSLAARDLALEAAFARGERADFAAQPRVFAFLRVCAAVVGRGLGQDARDLGFKAAGFVAQALRVAAGRSRGATSVLGLVAQGL